MSKITRTSAPMRQESAATVDPMAASPDYRESSRDARLIRLADIVLSIIGILLTFPLMILSAIAVKLDSPGRAIFSQTRLGTRGEPFEILKFRKFPDDWGDAGPGITVSGDTRMTSVGRILERTKLDELPQLFNILKGDMSLVGPRPETMRYREYFKGPYLEILKYKPGLFGPAQVAIPNEPSMYPPEADPEDYYRDVLFPMKSEIVLQYYRNANLASYFGILVKGVWVTALRIVDWDRWARQTLPWLAADTVVITFAWLMAFVFRYSGLSGYDDAVAIGPGLVVTLVCCLVLMLVTGVYRRDVKRFAFNDALRTMVCVVAGWTFAFVVILGVVYRNASVLVGIVGLVVATSGIIALRYIRRERYRSTIKRDTVPRVRIVIYGADEFAMGIGSLLNTAFGSVMVRGVLDDDPDNRGRVVSGLKVLGSERDLGLLHQTHPFEQLWIAFEPDKTKSARLDAWCAENGVEPVYPLRSGAFANLTLPA